MESIPGTRGGRLSLPNGSAVLGMLGTKSTEPELAHRLERDQANWRPLSHIRGATPAQNPSTPSSAQPEQEDRCTGARGIKVRRSTPPCGETPRQASIMFSCVLQRAMTLDLESTTATSGLVKTQQDEPRVTHVYVAGIPALPSNPVYTGRDESCGTWWRQVVTRSSGSRAKPYGPHLIVKGIPDSAPEQTGMVRESMKRGLERNRARGSATTEKGTRSPL